MGSAAIVGLLVALAVVVGGVTTFLVTRSNSSAESGTPSGAPTGDEDGSADLMPSDPTGPTTDTVAFTNGEGVRYRYSPMLSDVVPGNGPFEGDPVTVYCYVRGQAVHRNRNWALVRRNPEYYVPATYLLSGHDGGIPPGVPTC